MAKKDNLYIKKNNRGSNAVTVILVIALIIVVAFVAFLGIKVYKGEDVFGEKNPSSGSNSTDGQNSDNGADNDKIPEPTDKPEENLSPVVESEMTIGTRFNPPEGYKRVEVAEGSFGEYIRNYALKEYGSIAYQYETAQGGSLITNPKASGVGVFQQKIDLTKWQQCADSIIMLYAEYLWENQRYD